MVKSIAYLGPVGTYTQEAALLYDSEADLQPFPSVAAAGSAVVSGMTQQAVVPIENSLEGSVNFTLDLLIGEPGLFICNEIVIPIEHFLMAKPGTRASDIEVVYSHPQALAQCRDFLERCFPKAERMASLSTVTAVADMMDSPLPAASISPRRAAELHNVEIISTDIQDSKNNVTRFAVLGLEDHLRTGNDKTSMCLSFPDDAPGLLHQTLGEFASRGINLVKIESRPTKHHLGEYIFLIDCHGHKEDGPVKEAIQAISQPTNILRILGSYPRWQ